MRPHRAQHMAGTGIASPGEAEVSLYVTAFVALVLIALMLEEV